MRGIALLVALIVLPSCIPNTNQPVPPELELQRTRTALRAVGVSIQQAGVIVDQLTATGDISAEDAESLYKYGQAAIVGLEAALLVSEELESVELGQQTLLTAVSTILVNIDAVLDQFDLPPRVRLILAGIQSGLLVAQAFGPV